MPEQKPIWSPDQDHIQKTQMFQFVKKMGKQDYNELHRWSVDHFEDFWKEMLKFSGIIYEGLEDPVIHLKNNELITPGGHFFPNIKLNFAKTFSVSEIIKQPWFPLLNLEKLSVTLIKNCLLPWVKWLHACRKWVFSLKTVLPVSSQTLLRQ